MKKKYLISVCLFALLPMIVQAEDRKMLITVKRMTMETALTIAKGAIDACRKKQIQISVTVVDRAGVTQVALRDVLAPTVSLTISKQKAHAALAFNAKTSAMEGRFKSFGSVAKTEGLIFSAGGVPINAAGLILGAVGVSGAPSGKIDESCAQAGIDLVQDDLEMTE